MESLGRMMIMLGGVLLLAGLAFLYGGRWFGPLGRLPGDIIIRQGNFTFYAPLTTSLLLSAALTAVFWLINRLR